MCRRWRSMAGIGRGRNRDSNTTSTGRGATYLVRRLKRDAPEIAEGEDPEMPIGVAREPSFSAIRGLPATTLAARKMATSDANGGLWSRPCHVREAGRSCRSSAARSTCCSSARDRVPRQRSASAAAAGVPRRRARSTIATARATLSALLNLPRHHLSLAGVAICPIRPWRATFRARHRPSTNHYVAESLPGDTTARRRAR